MSVAIATQGRICPARANDLLKSSTSPTVKIITELKPVIKEAKEQ